MSNFHHQQLFKVFNFLNANSFFICYLVMDSSERSNCFVDVLEKVMGSVCGKTKDEPKAHQKKILGKVVLIKKNVLDVTDVGASVLDRVHEIFGKDISFRFISATHCDAENGNKGKLGKEARLVDWVKKLTSLEAEDAATFELQVDWDESMGVPGAFIVKNHHFSQLYLKSVTLENVHEHGQVHFDCNSWVYPAHRYSNDRIFFSNKIYLPYETPEPLRWYREQELINLRGNGKGALREWDRVYDYAYYNDLGSPERGEDFARPVLGGTKEYPYPRRGRTGRRPNKKDPKTESRLPLLSLDIYVPRDERFSSVKFSDFIAYALKSVGQVIGPEIQDVFDRTRNEFDTFEDVLRIYDNSKEVDLPDAAKLLKLRKSIPWELVRELVRSDGERFLKFPMPEVIQEDKTAWRTDEEFGREMLAGVNPVIIRCLKEFPPKSNLDRQVYGNQDSTIKREHIEKFMNGITVDEAIKCGKLYILDHHDALMLYLRRINTTTTRTYATRTVLLLQDDGTLKPLAIELSLLHEEGDQYGAISEVFTPCDEGVEGAVWQLAKAYAAVNDSGYHQLISHFLNTHAVIEPFLIATHRQLSVMHPINKLLHPHFRDTMYINALARQILINAGGVLETTVFPARYAMEMSSAVYKSWNFNDQALPQDLINRGMAVKAENQPHGLRLMIEDYPYAVDGLEIWSAIESWVREYCSIYYPTDDKVRADSELQSWWTEVREVGHGDLKNEPWWPKMQTREELVQSCTIIIWIASALHAAVNFGQYPFAGYLPNRPTVSRRFMPKKGTPEFAELETNPDGVFFKTITAQFQTLLGISLIEILSRHSSDEIYLGQRDSAHWTDDKKPLEAFKKFGSTLMEIEERILQRNKDSCLKNRTGPVKLDYMLLFPNTSGASQGGGLLTKGIPNSISI